MLLNQINSRLENFKCTYGIDLLQSEQGSEEWLRAKLGVISASNAAKIVSSGAARNTYMMGLIAQVCTGEQEEINAKALSWGKDNENAARALYSFQIGKEIKEVSFIFKDDDFRVGISPDGLIGDDRGFEIKCPFNSANYIDFLVNDKMKPEWEKQVQFSMWVTGLGVWDFAQYDPRMSKKLIRIIETERKEKMMKTFDDAVPQFISDMDKCLKKIGFKFGDQWALNKKEAA